MEKLKTLVLIPARGNSKSIKKKNLLKINNKTLIQTIFESARKSKLVDKVICSSEDNIIIKHCKKIGLSFILRPAILSRDNSDIFYTARHTLKVLEKEGESYDIIILAQPTSPFVNSKIYNKIIELMSQNKNISSCQTIHNTPHNYHYLNTRILNKKNNMVSFKFKKLRKNKINKQKKEMTFNFGNLVGTRVNKLFYTKDFFCEPSAGIIIDKFSSFDLDSENDVKFLKSVKKIIKVKKYNKEITNSLFSNEQK
jgi:CMP-N-acetylneuraminic acid synthetase